MARPLRIEHPGALYHVTSRGDGREDIYLDDSDRQQFLQILGKVCRRMEWRCYAYCLMGNHYHLLIETPKANLARGMRQLNGVYTQTFNRVHRRVGHVFQGRYKAILVQRDPYLMELCRYIVLNPVRAKMARKAESWLWSSHQVILGTRAAPPWLYRDEVLSLFSNQAARARSQYAKFVADGVGGPRVWESLRQQIYLGDDGFLEQMQRKIDKAMSLSKASEVPRQQRKPKVETLEAITGRHPEPAAAMAEAYLSGHYRMHEIARHFGVHYATVSRAVKRLENV